MTARDRAPVFTFESELWLPRPLPEVFAFFAEPRNLETITPAWLHFEILSPMPLALSEGSIIDYRLRLRGLPIRWQTEITAWEPPYRFVDTQRRGPYRRWVHEHRFVEKDGGTLALDHVDYDILGGRLVHELFVRRDVEKIFSYRRCVLSHYFDPTGPATVRPVAACRRLGA